MAIRIRKRCERVSILLPNTNPLASVGDLSDRNSHLSWVAHSTKIYTTTLIISECTQNAFMPTISTQSQKLSCPLRETSSWAQDTRCSTTRRLDKAKSLKPSGRRLKK